MNLKQSIPWQVKIASKIILSRIPVPYSIWKKLGLFEHGSMNKEEWAYDVFLTHAKQAGVIEMNGNLPKFKKNSSPFAVLELGPGDSLFSAMIASALGAEKTFLIDTGDYASKDTSLYLCLNKMLRDKGFDLKHLNQYDSILDILKKSNSSYLTNGVQSLSEIPDNSIDYCFSNAVLEHVSKYDFETLSEEIKRVLKAGGRSIHRVDLKDHLGGNLNNLRFSESLWESPLFKNAGFYTNRIRFEEMKSIFTKEGLRAEVPRITKWEQLPTPRSKLNKAFSALSDENLLISGFDLILEKEA